MKTLGTLAFAGEKQLFNGKDLTGWKGQVEFWSMRDGAITGHTTAEHMVKENTFLIWDGQAGDFELTFKYKLTDMDGKSEKFGNSGVQYRSKVVKPEYSVVAGYQADMEREDLQRHHLRGEGTWHPREAGRKSGDSQGRESEEAENRSRGQPRHERGNSRRRSTWANGMTTRSSRRETT